MLHLSKFKVNKEVEHRKFYIFKSLIFDVLESK